MEWCSSENFEICSDERILRYLLLAMTTKNGVSTFGSVAHRSAHT